MSKPKKKIGLIATEIEFKKHSIIYKVKFDSVLNFSDMFQGVVMANNDIKNKDLILKTTYLDQDFFEVVFVPINVTPQFYQKIFLETNSKLSKEYQIEKSDIYSVGDIVGFIMI